MPVRLDIEFPEDNRIELSPKFLAESDAVVTVRGRGNRLYVEDPLVPNAAKITLADGATVLIRSDSNLNELQISALAKGTMIEIGAWCSFTGRSKISAHECSTITIGPFGLFGDGCRIISSDVHKILDVVTRERLNPAGDIRIGDHVWAAENVTFLRNTVVGSHSVVGSGSILRNAFPANVVIAGVPARVVRTGVTWEF